MCFTCLLVCFKHIRIDPNCTTQWETWHCCARMIQTRNPKPTTNTRTKTETWTRARSSSSNKTPPFWQKYKQQGSCVISRCGKTCWRGSAETPKLFVSCAHTLKWRKHKVKSKTKNVPTMSAQTQEDSHNQQTWSGTQRCRFSELLITLRPFCSHLLTSSRDCSSVAPIHAVLPSYFNIQHLYHRVSRFFPVCSFTSQHGMCCRNSCSQVLVLHPQSAGQIHNEAYRSSRSWLKRWLLGLVGWLLLLQMPANVSESRCV